MAQLMALPLTISCSSKSKLVLPSWFYRSGASSSGWSWTKSERAVKWLCVLMAVKTVHVVILLIISSAFLVITVGCYVLLSPRELAVAFILSALLIMRMAKCRNEPFDSISKKIVFNSRNHLATRLRCGGIFC